MILWFKVTCKLQVENLRYAEGMQCAHQPKGTRKSAGTCEKSREESVPFRLLSQPPELHLRSRGHEIPHRSINGSLISLRKSVTSGHKLRIRVHLWFALAEEVSDSWGTSTAFWARAVFLDHAHHKETQSLAKCFRRSWPLKCYVLIRALLT